jgi:hypothetical protein
MFVAASLAIAFCAPASAHIWDHETGFPAYQFGPTTTQTNAESMSLGFSFSVQHSTGFGGVAYWDDGRDGFIDAHRINLYEQLPDGINVLMISTVIGAGQQGQFAYCQSGRDGCWRWVRTYPTLQLRPGVTYTLAGYSPGSADPWLLSSEPQAFPGINIGINAARYALGAMSEFPLRSGEPQTFDALAGYGAAAVNFAMVPEPAIWSLIVTGFALTGGALRSSRRRTRHASVRCAVPGR